MVISNKTKKYCEKWMGWGTNENIMKASIGDWAKYTPAQSQEKRVNLRRTYYTMQRAMPDMVGALKNIKVEVETRKDGGHMVFRIRHSCAHLPTY